MKSKASHARLSASAWVAVPLALNYLIYFDIFWGVVIVFLYLVQIQGFKCDFLSSASIQLLPCKYTIVAVLVYKCCRVGIQMLPCLRPVAGWLGQCLASAFLILGDLAAVRVYGSASREKGRAGRPARPAASGGQRHAGARLLGGLA